MKAFKLINTPDGLSAFQEGTLPALQHITAGYFYFQSHIEESERRTHPAPHYQFVITLKGRLRFTVSNGSSFIIEPGVMLIADDVNSEGHSWELIEGDEWQRIYIVLPREAEDHFKIAGGISTIE